MKKVSFVVHKFYYNNIIFDKKQTVLKISNLDKYHKLYDLFKLHGYDIASNDINTIDESEFVLYFDMPKVMPKHTNINKSFLLALESSIIRPDNFDLNKHKYFNKIFTWDDTLVDDKKYFKINYAFKIPNVIPKNLYKEKECCLIIGNKDSSCLNELYSERKKAIRWFEENYPENFDLYGIGWNEYTFKGIKLIRALNRIPIARKIMFQFFGEFFPSYKGEVSNKFDIMQNYKFTICYENVKNDSGYITEKIFDAFFAGCVPIYLGANNVTEYIPSKCFIDKRDFNSYDELYKFLHTMSDKNYMQYLINIENFLNSDEVKKFSSINFAKTIVYTMKGKK